MGKNSKNLDKVAAIDNDYSKEQYAEFQKQQKQLIFRRRRLAVIFLITFVIFAFSGFQLMKDYQKLSDFKKQKVETVAESGEMDKELKRLEQDVALLKDEDYVAKLARSRYYLSKEGEQIYTVPELNGTVNSNSESKQPSSEESQPQSQASSN